jgi:hypothetical protein
MASSTAMASFYSHRELTGRRWPGEISMHVENDGGGRRFGIVGQRRWQHGYNVVADLLEKELTGRSHLLVRERKGRGEGLLLCCWAKGWLGQPMRKGRGKECGLGRGPGADGGPRGRRRREEKSWAAAAGQGEGKGGV